MVIKENLLVFGKRIIGGRDLVAPLIGLCIYKVGV